MLKYRLISGLSLFGLLCVAVFWNSPISAAVFVLLAITFMYFGLREFFTMTGNMGFAGYPTLTMLAGLVYIGLIGVNGVLLRSGKSPVPHLEWALNSTMFAFICLSALITLKAVDDLKAGIRSLVASIGGFMYICWMLSFLLRIYFIGVGQARDHWVGPYLMFFVIMVTKCGDIGGYTVGRLSSLRKGGNHKMVPRLSPGKSWEGFCGSLLFSVGAAVVLVAIKGGSVGIHPHPIIPKSTVLLDYSIAIVLGLILGTIGLLGDLVESALKRAAEVKDSGSVLPGMGGMLDALDSLILIAPMCCLFLEFLILRG